MFVPDEHEVGFSTDYNMHVAEMKGEPHLLMRSMSKKMQAREFYYSIGPNVLPPRRRPEKRWRWAIQKVLHQVRSGKVKVSETTATNRSLY
jgi:hypothetical protein